MASAQLALQHNFIDPYLNYPPPKSFKDHKNSFVCLISSEPSHDKKYVKA